ncbi:MAG: hypothetical protein V8S95_02830 [Odoribacter sp.]
MTDNTILQTLLFMLGISLASGIITLPFDDATFHIEEKYGFNKTTVKTYVGDLLKGMIIDRYHRGRFIGCCHLVLRMGWSFILVVCLGGRDLVFCFYGFVISYPLCPC